MTSPGCTLAKLNFCCYFAEYEANGMICKCLIYSCLNAADMKTSEREWRESYSAWKYTDMADWREQFNQYKSATGNY